jgi:hypothetical protein
MKMIQFDNGGEVFMPTLNGLGLLVMIIQPIFPVAGAETPVGATESLGAVHFPHEKNQKKSQDA